MYTLTENIDYNKKAKNKDSKEKGIYIKQLIKLVAPFTKQILKIHDVFAGMSFISVRVRRRTYSDQRVRATACLLSVRVRILPGAWMSVSCEVVCCQVVSATGLSHIQRSP
jgi:hypothetical protein